MYSLNLEDRLTPFSINSAAKIEFSILSQGHWYDALRIAENVIQEKSDALEYAKIAQKEQEQKIDYQKANLKDYSELEQISILADIERWTVDVGKQNRLIEDAEFERDVALRLKKKILSENPEIEDMGYKAIQDIGSYQAYIDTKAEQIAVTFAGRIYNLPPEIFQFLLRGDADCTNKVKEVIPEKLAILRRELPQLMQLFESRLESEVQGSEVAKLESMLNDNS